jgi:hypothetical protein
MFGAQGGRLLIFEAILLVFFTCLEDRNLGGHWAAKL